MAMVTGRWVVHQSCLSCHGEPRGDRDITGGKKEGQKEGDLAGALSWTIPVR
jgi:hypothetical protein